MNVAFYTLGCKVNQYETEAMREAFEAAGHTAVQTPQFMQAVRPSRRRTSSISISKYFPIKKVTLLDECKVTIKIWAARWYKYLFSRPQRALQRLRTSHPTIRRHPRQNAVSAPGTRLCADAYSRMG